MAEKIAQETRSRMMAGIRGENTKPELIVRSRLHADGLRFRLHDRELPGKPDLVLRRWNALVFVHGCFWHGHGGCKYFRLPRTRPEFWRQKIEGNKARDLRTLDAVARIGWRVAIVWECAIRDDCQQSLSKLVSFVRSESPHVEIGSPEGAISVPDE
ncbi:DNA glycosylase [Arenimonas malthae CC-JY-1]|uniref:Very short patch repair endonuclease n=1 Tax=Arenimonas malthae CC-JY-1 TaxID=1384054 RepID=A0A091B790_9GAMM|nr:very short patch repair endonuclease [Arenimonas malthae]KFN48483.1 DNA glycosylase [Arenimonas malthae CC-JY-1]